MCFASKVNFDKKKKQQLVAVTVDNVSSMDVTEKKLQILKFNTKFNPTPFLNIEYRFNMVTFPPLVPEGCCTIINYTQKRCFHRTL